MKKLKLKRWVKVLLIVFAIVGLVVINNIQYKKAVTQCVNAGNTQNYCEKGLK